MQKEITHTWYFKQSPEVVWEYLTKPELMEAVDDENGFSAGGGTKISFI